MPKKITIRCYGPIALNRKYKSPWEDFYLSWTGKPGRKKYRLAPYLCSRPDIEWHHRRDLETQEKNEDADLGQRILQDTLILEALGKGRIYIEDGDTYLPNVYTPAEFIDRAEAERLIAELMKLRGFDKIRCKWKRPKVIVIPV